MNLLAAWLGNPVEYWLNLIGLVVIIVVGVFLIRKFRGQKN